MRMVSGCRGIRTMHKFGGLHMWSTWSISNANPLFSHSRAHDSRIDNPSASDPWIEDARAKNFNGSRIK